LVLVPVAAPEEADPAVDLVVAPVVAEPAGLFR
jgi:hypothetical protein